MSGNNEKAIGKAIGRGEFDLFDLNTGKRKNKFLFLVRRFFRKNFLLILAVVAIIVLIVFLRSQQMFIFNQK